MEGDEFRFVVHSEIFGNDESITILEVIDGGIFVALGGLVGSVVSLPESGSGVLHPIIAGRSLYVGVDVFEVVFNHNVAFQVNHTPAVLCLCYHAIVVRTVHFEIVERNLFLAGTINHTPFTVNLHGEEVVSHRGFGEGSVLNLQIFLEEGITFFVKHIANFVAVAAGIPHLAFLAVSNEVVALANLIAVLVHEEPAAGMVYHCKFSGEVGVCPIFNLVKRLVVAAHLYIFLGSQVVVAKFA